MGMGPVVRSLKDALDGMPVHVRQLGEMFRRHGRTQKRSIADVHDLDAMRVDAPRPRTTPGFHADGTVKAEDFRTPRDGAYYWSGMYPRKGDEIAGEIAASHGGTTLEQLIDARGIQMPQWDADNPDVVATWTRVSEAYASGASGEVRAVLGDNLRPGAVWWSELERLKANDAVTKVIRVHPDTLVETVIWPD